MIMQKPAGGARETAGAPREAVPGVVFDVVFGAVRGHVGGRHG
ncbi:hypothetical protein [Planotetraspora silvatica]|nr:hypothetical protein [Planotetraspora silvatica]